MKDYKEMADSVYMTVQQENIRKAKRAMVVRRTVTGCIAFAGVFGVVIGVSSMGKDINLNPDNILSPGAEATNTAERTTDTHSQHIIFSSFNGESNEPPAATDKDTESSSETESTLSETDGSSAETMQIGWIKDKDGNVYPAYAPVNEQTSVDILVTKGLKPSDADKILAALNYCFDNKKGGEFENVKVISFSPKHYSVHVECGMGEEIYALEDGKVITADWSSGNGKCVKVANDAGNVISYCYLSDFNVKEGDKVTAGQVVGYAGNSGITTYTSTCYSISGLADALDPGNEYEPTKDVSFVSDVVANRGISTNDTKVILAAINQGNSLNDSISADNPTMDITLEGGIKVRAFAHHTVLLLNTEENEKVYAITGGKVVSSGIVTEFSGGSIEVLTDSGEYVSYKHLGEVDVELGDVIEEGQVLGKAGRFEGETEYSVLYSVREK